jgi:hypothetical protein
MTVVRGRFRPDYLGLRSLMDWILLHCANERASGGLGCDERFAVALLDGLVPGEVSNRQLSDCRRRIVSLMSPARRHAAEGPQRPWAADLDTSRPSKRPRS